MKNLPFSAILLGASLVAGLVQASKASPQIWPDILGDLLPYAIVCAPAAFVRLPNVANWFLCCVLPYVAFIGITAYDDVSTSGSCMGGFNSLTGYIEQVFAAVAAAIFALLAKAAASLYRRYAHNAQQPAE